MRLTKDNTGYINQEAIGYLVNTGLSTTLQNRILKIQRRLIDAFGDAIWCAPTETLHITLMDWLAPLITYDKPKDALFEDIYPAYDEALKECLINIGKINITFDTIRASETAVFAVGHDNGQINIIRHNFLNKITLLPDTKSPPDIIHFSIARFTARLKIEDVENVLTSCSINLVEEVNSFRLIRETKLPMLEYQKLKEYKL